MLDRDDSRWPMFKIRVSIRKKMRESHERKWSEAWCIDRVRVSCYACIIHHVNLHSVIMSRTWIGNTVLNYISDDHTIERYKIAQSCGQWVETPTRHIRQTKSDSDRYIYEARFHKFFLIILFEQFCVRIKVCNNFGETWTV